MPKLAKPFTQTELGSQLARIHPRLGERGTRTYAVGGVLDIIPVMDYIPLVLSTRGRFHETS